MRTLGYEDLPGLAGQDLGRSEWMIVDQGTIDAFAEVTRDHQWIHVDAGRAAEEGGTTIAHGFLSLALIPALSSELLEVRGITRTLNCGLNRLRFLAPVPSGSRVRLSQRVLAVEQRPQGLQIVSECTLEIEGAARPAFVAETIMLAIP